VDFLYVEQFVASPASPKRWRQPTDKETRAALLLAVWALAILVFFSFSTRQEYYVLPSLPALALLCDCG